MTVGAGGALDVDVVEEVVDVGRMLELLDVVLSVGSGLATAPSITSGSYQQISSSHEASGGSYTMDPE